MGARDGFAAWSHRNRFAVDAATAALVGLVVVPTATVTGASQWGPSDTAWPWAGPAASLVMSAAMAWRRSRPVASVAVVYSAALLHVLAGATVVMPADLIVPWALWSVTVHGPRWASRAALSGAMVGSVLVGTLLATTWADAAALSVMIALLFLTTWAFAQARRARRETMESLVDRAQRLEVERDQQAQLAAAAERARIAREMHDIVAHSLSVIIAQADGGRYAAAHDPAAAGRALTTIGETGRAALSDMRGLLGVLRAPQDQPLPTGGPAGERPDSPTGPLPATADLTALVEGMRTAGLRASLVRLGEPRILPPGTGLTVFRIAQEALTNVLKHAQATSVSVLVERRADELRVIIEDNGVGFEPSQDRADGTGGRQVGLIGMAERAALAGGTLAVESQVGTGTSIYLHLPLSDDALASTGGARG